MSSDAFIFALWDADVRGLLLVDLSFTVYGVVIRCYKAASAAL
jgi:hypothetical protein